MFDSWNFSRYLHVGSEERAVLVYVNMFQTMFKTHFHYWGGGGVKLSPTWSKIDWGGGVQRVYKLEEMGEKSQCDWENKLWCKRKLHVYLHESVRYLWTAFVHLHQSLSVPVWITVLMILFISLAEKGYFTMEQSLWSLRRHHPLISKTNQCFTEKRGRGIMICRAQHYQVARTHGHPNTMARSILLE